MLKTLTASLQHGHQVAAGQSLTTPYPAGTIAMQTPFFKALGLDLSCYYQCTLNLSLSPLQFEIVQAGNSFLDIKWAKGFTAENFSFLACTLVVRNTSYPCLFIIPTLKPRKDIFKVTVCWRFWHQKSTAYVMVTSCYCSMTSKNCGCSDIPQRTLKLTI